MPSEPIPFPRKSGRQRRGTSEATRQRIVDALVELLDEHAIWEISITMLTRRIGVSSQLFYHHFTSLDDVLAVHWDAVFRDLPDIAALLEGDWSDTEAFDRMLAVAKLNLAFWDRHRPAMRVLSMLDDMQKPRFARFRQLRGRSMAGAFAALARRQKEKGRLPDTVSDQLAGWECTARLQQFGLTFPEIIAQGADAGEAIVSHATILAISLGFDPRSWRIQEQPR
ncbi:MAG: TetR/AcrR family transcriptional regulator [Novosphingobium sp.]|nr:TetR/AcrR family transcriptional regulator [Novosphingobium sp.]